VALLYPKTWLDDQPLHSLRTAGFNPQCYSDREVTPAEVLEHLPCKSSVYLKKNKVEDGDISGALKEDKGAANKRNVVKWCY
jgi:hypothetical protein